MNIAVCNHERLLLAAMWDQVVTLPPQFLMHHVVRFGA